MRDKDEIEARYSEVCSELSIYSSLLDHSGWISLAKIAEGQILQRQQSVFRTPLGSLDDALAQEFMKGEGLGIELFLKIPQVQMEVLQGEKNKLEQELKDVDQGIEGMASGSTAESRDVLDERSDTFGGE